MDDQASYVGKNSQVLASWSSVLDQFLEKDGERIRMYRGVYGIKKLESLKNLSFSLLVDFLKYFFLNSLFSCVVSLL